MPDKSVTCTGYSGNHVRVLPREPGFYLRPFRGDKQHSGGLVGTILFPRKNSINHLRVIKVEHGDSACHRGRNHIRRVVPTAHADFHNADVDSLPHEAPQAHLQR